MELLREEGLDVISPPRVTNIPSASAALTVGLEEDDSLIPEVRHVESPIDTELVASVSIPSRPTDLPSATVYKVQIGKCLFGKDHDYLWYSG